jgi:UDP-N-acetyl-D-mannosaminuronate dehydrogenase
VLVSTAHTDFKNAALYAKARLVIDTRNLMAPLGFGAPGAAGPEVVRA